MRATAVLAVLASSSGLVAALPAATMAERGFIDSAADYAANMVTGMGHEISDAVGDGISAAGHGASAVASDAMDGAKYVANTAMDGTKYVVETAADGVQTAASAGGHLAVGAMNKAEGMGKKIYSDIYKCASGQDADCNA